MQVSDLTNYDKLSKDFIANGLRYRLILKAIQKNKDLIFKKLLFIIFVKNTSPHTHKFLHTITHTRPQNETRRHQAIPSESGETKRNMDKTGAHGRSRIFFVFLCIFSRRSFLNYFFQLFLFSSVLPYYFFLSVNLFNFFLLFLRLIISFGKRKAKAGEARWLFFRRIKRKQLYLKRKTETKNEKKEN